MLQKETIEYNKEYVCPTGNVFLMREKTSSRIPEYIHVFDC